MPKPILNSQDIDIGSRKSLIKNELLGSAFGAYRPFHPICFWNFSIVAALIRFASSSPSQHRKNWYTATLQVLKFIGEAAGKRRVRICSRISREGRFLLIGSSDSDRLVSV